MPNKQQVAGKLGVSNNPAASPSVQRGARLDILKGMAGNNRAAVAGKIGVGQNPNASKSVQHDARVHVMHQVGKGK